MHPLIYDWNQVGAGPAVDRPVMLDDETLRDGVQSPSVRTPSIDDKIRILHLIDATPRIREPDLGRSQQHRSIQEFAALRFGTTQRHKLLRYVRRDDRTNGRQT